MGGLISSSGTKKIKEEKPTLRILRSFPIFGKRTLMLYFPKSVGAGFSYLPLRSLYDSHVSVGAVAGTDGEEAVQHYEVRSSKRSEPIIVMRTEAEAADVVRRLSAAIAPTRMKWVWCALGASVLFVFATSGGGGAPSAPALSIYTPMAPRVGSTSASGQVTQAPASVAPVLPAPSDAQTPKPTDVNDPFGLKLAPEAAK